MDAKYYLYKESLNKFLTALNRASNTGILANALLATGGTASQMKTTNAISYQIDGILASLAATAAIPFTATTHDIAAGKERQFLVTVDASGTVAVVAGDEADAGESVLPDVPSDVAVIGSIKILCNSETAFDATTTLLSNEGLTVTYTQGLLRDLDGVVGLIE